MDIFLTLAFLFFIGSTIGWVMELLYRNLTHHRQKWINPGFCTGPYVPLYGFGLCLLYLIASLESLHLIQNPFWNRTVLFLTMAAAMTLIEYIAGILCLKVLKVRLWDYSDYKGNLQGIICPQFSLIWAVLGAVYYFLIHPHILNALDWLSQNLAFSFVIGFFFGVFIIDVALSAQLTARLRQYAIDHNFIVRYENLKQLIRSRPHLNPGRYGFFRPFKANRPLHELLKEMQSQEEKRRESRKNHNT